jgi:integrase
MSNASRRERVERNVYRRTTADGKTAYEIGYRDSDGRQRWQVVQGGIRAARTQLADVKARMGRGERVAPAPHLSFREAADRWLEAQAATLRPATREAYKSSLETHLLPAWGTSRLDRIDVDAVARLVERMQTTSYRAEVEQRLARRQTSPHGSARARARRQPEKGYAAWTIRNALVPAGRVFDFARRRLGWAGENPVRLLDRSERPRSDQRERRVLSGEELRRLLAATEDRYRLIFAFAAGTGARLGETLGLKWRCIDFGRGTVSLTHQLDRWGECVQLKTKRSRRTVELPASLLSALRAQKLATQNSRPDAYVFATRDGRPLEHRNIGGRVLARAVKAAKLHEQPGQSDPTFHSFRHSFASAWIAAGGDLVELSAHLGHRDPAVTASVYSHEFEKAARSDERRARLDGMFAGLNAAPTGAATSEATAAVVPLAGLE